MASPAEILSTLLAPYGGADTPEQLRESLNAAARDSGFEKPEELFGKLYETRDEKGYQTDKEMALSLASNSISRQYIIQKIIENNVPEKLAREPEAFFAAIDNAEDVEAYAYAELEKISNPVVDNKVTTLDTVSSITPQATQQSTATLDTSAVSPPATGMNTGEQRILPEDIPPANSAIVTFSDKLLNRYGGAKTAQNLRTSMEALVQEFKARDADVDSPEKVFERIKAIKSDSEYSKHKTNASVYNPLDTRYKIWALEWLEEQGLPSKLALNENIFDAIDQVDALEAHFNLEMLRLDAENVLQVVDVVNPEGGELKTFAGYGAMQRFLTGLGIIQPGQDFTAQMAVGTLQSVIDAYNQTAYGMEPLVNVNLLDGYTDAEGKELVAFLEEIKAADSRMSVSMVLDATTVRMMERWSEVGINPMVLSPFLVNPEQLRNFVHQSSVNIALEAEKPEGPSGTGNNSTGNNSTGNNSTGNNSTGNTGSTGDDLETETKMTVEEASTLAQQTLNALGDALNAAGYDVSTPESLDTTPDDNDAGVTGQFGRESNIALQATLQTLLSPTIMNIEVSNGESWRYDPELGKAMLKADNVRDLKKKIGEDVYNSLDFPALITALDTIYNQDKEAADYDEKFGIHQTFYAEAEVKVIPLSFVQREILNDLPDLVGDEALPLLDVLSREYSGYGLDQLDDEVDPGYTYDSTQGRTPRLESVLKQALESGQDLDALEQAVLRGVDGVTAMPFGTTNQRDIYLESVKSGFAALRQRLESNPGDLDGAVSGFSAAFFMAHDAMENSIGEVTYVSGADRGVIVDPTIHDMNVSSTVSIADAYVAYANKNENTSNPEPLIYKNKDGDAMIAGVQDGRFMVLRIPESAQSANAYDLAGFEAVMNEQDYADFVRAHDLASAHGIEGLNDLANMATQAGQFAFYDPDINRARSRATRVQAGIDRADQLAQTELTAFEKRFEEQEKDRLVEELGGEDGVRATYDQSLLPDFQKQFEALSDEEKDERIEKYSEKYDIRARKITPEKYAELNLLEYKEQFSEEYEQGYQAYFDKTLSERLTSEEFKTAQAEAVEAYKGSEDYTNAVNEALASVYESALPGVGVLSSDSNVSGLSNQMGYDVDDISAAYDKQNSGIREADRKPLFFKDENGVPYVAFVEKDTGIFSIKEVPVDDILARVDDLRSVVDAGTMQKMEQEVADLRKQRDTAQNNLEKFENDFRDPSTGKVVFPDTAEGNANAARHEDMKREWEALDDQYSRKDREWQQARQNHYGNDVPRRIAEEFPLYAVIAHGYDGKQVDDPQQFALTARAARPFSPVEKSIVPQADSFMPKARIAGIRPYRGEEDFRVVERDTYKREDGTIDLGQWNLALSRESLGKSYLAASPQVAVVGGRTMMYYKVRHPELEIGEIDHEISELVDDELKTLDQQYAQIKLDMTKIPPGAARREKEIMLNDKLAQIRDKEDALGITDLLKTREQIREDGIMMVDVTDDLNEYQARLESGDMPSAMESRQLFPALRLIADNYQFRGGNPLYVHKMIMEGRFRPFDPNFGVQEGSGGTTLYRSGLDGGTYGGSGGAAFTLQGAETGYNSDVSRSTGGDSRGSLTRHDYRSDEMRVPSKYRAGSNSSGFNARAGSNGYDSAFEAGYERGRNGMSRSEARRARRKAAAETFRKSRRRKNARQAGERAGKTQDKVDELKTDAVIVVSEIDMMNENLRLMKESRSILDEKIEDNPTEDLLKQRKELDAQIDGYSRDIEKKIRKTERLENRIERKLKKQDRQEDRQDKRTDRWEGSDDRRQEKKDEKARREEIKENAKSLTNTHVLEELDRVQKPSPGMPVQQ